MAAVTMWEVKAATGRLDELLDWVLGRLAPDWQADRWQVYRSDEQERLVVIGPAGQLTRRLADPPAELIDRPAHAWNFEPVDFEPVDFEPVDFEPVDTSEPTGNV